MARGDEVVIVDNGTGPRIGFYSPSLKTQLWHSPWPLGVPVAFNVGVGLAKNEHVLLMGSDDKLLPGCLDACRKSIKTYDDPLGWYYLGVEYSDGRRQNTPCHASVITKELWNLTGGFPPESAVGACDTILLSALMRAKGKEWKGDFYKVSEKSFYWVRVHPEMETIRRSNWMPIADQVRALFAIEWKP
jgi:hypothetical protein